MDSVHEISQAKYWSGLPFPSPGDLLHPGIKLVSPALAGTFFTIEPPGNYGRGIGFDMKYPPNKWRYGNK